MTKTKTIVHEWMKPGAKVWTRTVSGERVLCTVIGQGGLSAMPNEWFLDSPSHGYQIIRHVRECEPV